MIFFKRGKFLNWLIVICILLVVVQTSVFYFSSPNINRLLTQNEKLKSAINNLTAEEQIGYATLLSPKTAKDGRIYSEVRFVQSAAGYPKQITSVESFTVIGDVVHFDALIVKFNNELVQRGKQHALYIWRRIYGDSQQPDKGLPIEQPNSAPERYYEISKTLRIDERKVFWKAIWDLANEPEKLSKHGVSAVFGNAIYCQMQSGKVNLFKINSSGQIYPEIINTY